MAEAAPFPPTPPHLQPISISSLKKQLYTNTKSFFTITSDKPKPGNFGIFSYQCFTTTPTLFLCRKSRSVIREVWKRHLRNLCNAGTSSETLVDFAKFELRKLKSPEYKSNSNDHPVDVDVSFTLSDDDGNFLPPSYESNGGDLNTPPAPMPHASPVLGPSTQLSPPQSQSQCAAKILKPHSLPPSRHPATTPPMSEPSNQTLPVPQTPLPRYQEPAGRIPKYFLKDKHGSIRPAEFTFVSEKGRHFLGAVTPRAEILDMLSTHHESSLPSQLQATTSRLQRLRTELSSVADSTNDIQKRIHGMEDTLNSLIDSADGTFRTVLCSAVDQINGLGASMLSVHRRLNGAVEGMNGEIRYAGKLRKGITVLAGKYSDLEAVYATTEEDSF